jgi:hypothetical protein
MLENIRGLCSWCHEDYRMIYRILKRRIVKQDESDDDLEFIIRLDLEAN